VAYRLSDSEETVRDFNGESNYMFMPTALTTDSQFWFSSLVGELRQIDVFVEPGLVKSFRYENYAEIPGENLKFPRVFKSIYRDISGEKESGWEYTIFLTNLEINGVRAV